MVLTVFAGIAEFERALIRVAGVHHPSQQRGGDLTASGARAAARCVRRSAKLLD
jgi:hypothetical protein